MVLYSLLSLFFITHLELLSYYLSNFSLYFIDSKISKHEPVSGLSFYFLSLNGKFPTLIESLVILVISLFLFFVNYKSKILPLPFKVWLNFILIILIFSSLFFIFFADRFPYTLNDFSLIYIILQIGLISFIPIVIGFPLALFSFSWLLLLTNFFIIIITLIYSFIFGAIRYALFLYILKEYSFLWMANLFFNFGPLLDMIYISGIYAFYISILSKKSRQSIKIWRWIF